VASPGRYASEELGRRLKCVAELNGVRSVINFDGRYTSLVTYASEFSGTALNRKPPNDLSAMWFSPVSDASNGSFRLQSNCKAVSITRLLPCFHEAAAIQRVMRGIIYTCSGRH
jgi:hypothetical protein